MGLREQIGKRPKLVVIGAGLCVAAFIASSFMTYSRGGGPDLPKIHGQAFYTVDEGATLFTDSLFKDAPFDKEGRQAVRAYVFTCDNGAHQWVQYLEKWSDSDEAQRALAANKPPGSVKMPDEGRLLVKTPGGKVWVKRKDPQSAAIVKPRCPPGMGDGPPASVQP